MTVLQLCANAINNLYKQTPSDVTDLWHATLENIESEYLPYGGGFDSGSHLDVKRSTVKQLCFTTAFHAMACGYYAGWIYLDVIVTPSLMVDFDTQVVVTDNQSDCDEFEINNLCDYIADTFYIALLAEVAPIP